MHLAGLALRATSDRAELLRSLAESDHDVADFLTSEVVDVQPPEVQAFVMATAELGLFDAALCDEVLGRSDSGAMLEHVRAQNLLLTRVEAAGGWYRYHHLFGAFLRARLRATAPGRVARLHDAAARAFVARDDLMSAVRHHVAAGDLPSAGRLLRRSVLSHLSIADQAVATSAARACLATVDLTSSDGSATDVLDCVAALSLAGAHREAEPWLRLVSTAESDLGADARCQLHTIWTRHLLHAGDPGAALGHAEAARAAAASAPDAAYAPSLLAVLTAHLDLLHDRIDDARAALAGIPLSEQFDHARPAIHVLGARALVELYAGELDEADRLATAAARTADDLGLDATNDSRAYAQLTLAALDIERDALDDADSGLERTMRIVEDGRRPALEAETRLHMARLAGIRGAERAALAHLDEARALQPHATPVVTGRIDRLQLRICLDLGDIQGAEATLARLPPSERGQLLTARLHLAAGRTAEAAEVLDRVAPSLDTRRSRIEHGVLAVLCLAAKHDGRTLAALDTLLDLARPAGFVRTIVGEGPAMWALLEALPTHSRQAGYVDRLLAAAKRVIPTPAVPERSSLVDPLTERELTVLRYLASRLDTSEIAQALYLSANTVRSHVKSIYRKLGVSSRSDAVAQGRRLGLFAATSRT